MYTTGTLWCNGCGRAQECQHPLTECSLHLLPQLLPSMKIPSRSCQTSRSSTRSNTPLFDPLSRKLCWRTSGPSRVGCGCRTYASSLFCWRCRPDVEGKENTCGRPEAGKKVMTIITNREWSCASRETRHSRVCLSHAASVTQLCQLSTVDRDPKAAQGTSKNGLLGGK